MLMPMMTRSVALSSFKVVVELELKHRENNKKIGILLMEMRDMMEALTECVERGGNDIIPDWQ